MAAIQYNGPLPAWATLMLFAQECHIPLDRVEDAPLLWLNRWIAWRNAHADAAPMLDEDDD